MINGFHLGEAENENSGGEAATRLRVFAAATRVERREIRPAPAGRALYHPSWHDWGGTLG